MGRRVADLPAMAAATPAKMEVKTLGRSGLHVSELCLGLMTMGTKPIGEHSWGMPSAPFEESCA